MPTPLSLLLPTYLWQLITSTSSQSSLIRIYLSVNNSRSLLHPSNSIIMSGLKPVSCIITLHINCPHIQSSQLCARCENNADSTSADSCTQVIEKARLRGDTSVLTKNNVTYTNMPGMCQACYDEDLKKIGEQFDHYVTTSERRMKRLRIAR